MYVHGLLRGVSVALGNSDKLNTPFGTKRMKQGQGNWYGERHISRTNKWHALGVSPFSHESLIFATVGVYSQVSGSRGLTCLTRFCLASTTATTTDCTITGYIP